MLYEVEVRNLEPSESWMRLASRNIGRLAVSVGALPIAVPVTYLVGDRESLIFAVEPNTALASALDRTVFAFETGGFDAETDRWWSVSAHGQVHLVPDRHPSARRLDDLHVHADVHPALGIVEILRGGEVQSSQHLPALATHLTSRP